MPRWLCSILLGVLLLNASVALAKGVYLSVDQFVQAAFDDAVPARRKLWLSGEQREQLQAILGHAVGLRVSYWQAQDRSAWILEEIGKELPITIGIVVEAGQLLDVRILAFRESRGGEVRYPFFTRQFVGLTLQSDNRRLSATIDGISGATMSVDAVTRAAQAALFMAQQANVDAYAQQGGVQHP